jgi:hypothetical protein
VLSNEGRPVDSILTGERAESTCFDDLPPGRYQLDAIPPPGCRLISGHAWQIQLGTANATIQAGCYPVRHSTTAWPTFVGEDRSTSQEASPPGLIALWVLLLAAATALCAVGLYALVHRQSVQSAPGEKA